ncbi:MAG: hypothetical protein JKX73_11605 [Flavobacteriales bacterium]|nr:hypothetical protein [Flavobacteriales bacterium]
MANPSKKIESKYWLDEEGILRIKVGAATDLHITLSDAKRHVRKCIALSGGLPRLLLIDLREVSGSISREASEFIKSNTELNALKRAEGFIADTLATHLIIRFSFSFSNASYPIEIFSTEERAREWINALQ